jgi:hypothetical protein
VLERLQCAAGVLLPEEYVLFLAHSNGGEGSLGIEPGYFVLDSAEEAVECREKKAFSEFFPGFFVFGGNGAGELIAFDTREGGPFPIVMIDATNINLRESVVRIAGNFQEFVRAIGMELSQ